MAYKRIVISSGHSTRCQGAVGILNEVAEATKVVDRVADELRDVCEVKTYHDTVSTTQNENLNRIVDYHNSCTRDLDMSVHFNAFESTSKPMGTEVLYVTQSALASEMSLAIADAGDFINRGAKKRTDLFFLNNTAKPAILIEVCFVDSSADADLYGSNFGEICSAIASVLAGEEIETEPEEPGETNTVTGTVSWFGGPDDEGVAPDESLAFFSSIMDAPQLFLPEGTPGTEGKGLARRLNPFTHYLAMRWDYAKHSKSALASGELLALVRNLETGFALKAFPADWGPHEATSRIADLSPGLMEDLGLETDDEAEIIFPYAED